MSRIGNNPISVPESVSIKINDNVVEISGKNGSHSYYLHESININFHDYLIRIW